LEASLDDVDLTGGDHYGLDLMSRPWAWAPLAGRRAAMSSTSSGAPH